MVSSRDVCFFLMGTATSVTVLLMLSDNGASFVKGRNEGQIIPSANVEVSSPRKSRSERLCFPTPVAQLAPLPISQSTLLAETHNGEIGWTGLLARASSSTKSTRFDPLSDRAAANLSASTLPRYLQSPVPKGSWEVRLTREKVITLDEIAFGYDLWFEENQVFRHITWQGVAVMQDPSDAFAIQDMLYRVKPDLVIELGTNTGGGAFFYSSVMRSYNCDALVVTLDIIDVVERLRKVGRPGGADTPSGCDSCIFAPDHPYWTDGGILSITGPVTDPKVWNQVDALVKKAKTVVVIDDANHDYASTLKNLEAVYPWVTKNSFLLVQDTKMDRFDAHASTMAQNTRRKVKRGNSAPFWGPMRAVDDFLRNHSDQFVIDRRFEYFIYSQHHRGFLRRLE